MLAIAARLRKRAEIDTDSYGTLIAIAEEIEAELAVSEVLVCVSCGARAFPDNKTAEKHGDDCRFVG